MVFNSRNAIEHYFRMLEEMRIKIDPNTKYFCTTEAVANYLQKFIVYRKRKVFFGKRSLKDIESSIKKHKAKETFLLPCSNLGAKRAVKDLEDLNVEFTEAMMFRTVASDLSDLENVTYDVLVFFSPLGIESLFENFPDFKQNETRLAVFGKSTAAEVDKRSLHANIKAPAPGITSMTMALEKYLQVSNGD